MVTKAKEARRKLNMKGWPHETKLNQLKQNPRKAPFDFSKARKRRKMAQRSRRINRQNGSARR